MRTSLIRYVLLFALIGFGVACSPTIDESIAPIDLITEAAENIRQAESFQLEVQQSGADYLINTELGSVAFRRAQAQYVAPDVLQATVRLIAGGLPADVDIFSLGEQQWFRNAILTAGQWYHAPFAAGFNPEILIAQETGFKAALEALIDLEYKGLVSLEDGTQTHHLTGTANGADIAALLAGMVEMPGVVTVEVFIDTGAVIPVRFVITQPDTATADQGPTTWRVDVYGFDEAPVIEYPEGSQQ